MSAETNKAIIRRYMDEVVNQNNRDAARELLSPDMVWHLPGLPDLRGVAGDETLNSMFHGPFPDARVAVEDMVADGDLVATRLSYRGTHLGDFQGMPPTGKSFTMTGMQVARIADGRLVEAWALPDMLGLLQQLGAMPGPS